MKLIKPFFSLFILIPFCAQANEIVSVCKPLLDKEHICWYFDKNGKVIKKTRNWSLDIQAEKLSKKGK